MIFGGIVEASVQGVQRAEIVGPKIQGTQGTRALVENSPGYHVVRGSPTKKALGGFEIRVCSFQKVLNWNELWTINKNHYPGNNSAHLTKLIVPVLGAPLAVEAAFLPIEWAC